MRLHVWSACTNDPFAKRDTAASPLDRQTARTGTARQTFGLRWIVFQMPWRGEGVGSRVFAGKEWIRGLAVPQSLSIISSIHQAAAFLLLLPGPAETSLFLLFRFILSVLLFCLRHCELVSILIPYLIIFWLRFHKTLSSGSFSLLHNVQPSHNTAFFLLVQLHPGQCWLRCHILLTSFITRCSCCWPHASSLSTEILWARSPSKSSHPGPGSRAHWRPHQTSQDDV